MLVAVWLQHHFADQLHAIRLCQKGGGGLVGEGVVEGGGQPNQKTCVLCVHCVHCGSVRVRVRVRWRACVCGGRATSAREWWCRR